MHASISASQFLPDNSGASQFLVVLNVQMDNKFKKEQFGR